VKFGTGRRGGGAASRLVSSASVPNAPFSQRILTCVTSSRICPTYAHRSQPNPRRHLLDYRQPHCGLSPLWAYVLIPSFIDRGPQAGSNFGVTPMEGTMGCIVSGGAKVCSPRVSPSVAGSGDSTRSSFRRTGSDGGRPTDTCGPRGCRDGIKRARIPRSCSGRRRSRWPIRGPHVADD
jgi:hypothetical protein